MTLSSSPPVIGAAWSTDGGARGQGAGCRGDSAKAHQSARVALQKKGGSPSVSEAADATCKSKRGHLPTRYLSSTTSTYSISSLRQRTPCAHTVASLRSTASPAGHQQPHCRPIAPPQDRRSLRNTLWNTLDWISRHIEHFEALEIYHRPGISLNAFPSDLSTRRWGSSKTLGGSCSSPLPAKHKERRSAPFFLELYSVCTRMPRLPSRTSCYTAQGPARSSSARIRETDLAREASERHG